MLKKEIRLSFITIIKFSLETTLKNVYYSFLANFDYKFIFKTFCLEFVTRYDPFGPFATPF
jgi:hypothetical protein